MRLIDADALLEKYNLKVDSAAEILFNPTISEKFMRFNIIADALKSAPTINQWHKLSEPPKTDGTYWVMGKLKNMECNYYIFADYDPDKGWEEFEKPDNGQEVTFTHWIDLPEPPEEEDAEENNHKG